MTRRLLILSILLSFVAACWAADQADNEAARIFTAEIAQRLLGGAPDPAARNASADIKNGATIVSQSSFSTKDGSGRLESVSLLLRKAPTPAETKAIFLSSKATYKGEDVAGLGDLAYRTTAPAQLNVLKGRNWLIISAGVFPKADPELQERAAAELLKNVRE